MLIPSWRSRVQCDVYKKWIHVGKVSDKNNKRELNKKILW